MKIQKQEKTCGIVFEDASPESEPNFQDPDEISPQ